MPVPESSQRNGQGDPDTSSVVRVFSSETGSVLELPRVRLSNAEWKQRLTPEQYRVMREAGTEPAFSGKYWDSHERGTYVCASCGADLFTSNAKFDSECGWPSFFTPVDSLNVVFRPDHSHGMNRTEVICKRCGAHLGHVFDDGPAPTGLRYCINSASLGFRGGAPESTRSAP